MTTRVLGTVIIAIVATVVLLQQCGCSLIGLGVGSIIDSRKPKETSISSWQLFDVKQGTKVKLVLKDGRVIEGTFFDKYAITPEVFAIGISDELGVTQQISTDSVSYVMVPAKRSGAHTGFLIGLAVDVTVLIVAVVAANQHEDPPPRSDSIITSCPFVYSFADSSYIFDAEPLGAAICRSLQRTDLTVLNHIRESGGFYRFRITNELAETEFLDEVKLLVVDHPDSVQVVPSFDGTLHTVCSPQTPLSAIDYRGADMLGLVKHRDTESWVSNPFNRTPGVDSQIRDGLELEFAKPRDAQSVKLALNVQNTPWGAEMLNKVIALLGPEADAWCTRIARSADARESLEQAMIREGMLVVKVWNGSNWKDADFVWGVGPRMPKDQLVKLDVGDITGNRLRVRLESTAGFWMINSVLADYSPDMPLEITELVAAEATDQLGRDIRSPLVRTDDNYYVMPTNSDRAEIAFAAPDTHKGRNRSFVFKCSGYYNIHVPYGSEPHPELMARLISEPGAFGRFSLEMLNNEMNAALAGRNTTSLYHRW